MFRNVIVGYDGSEEAHDALALASALASRGATLTACAVHRLRSLSGRIDPTEPRIGREQAQRALAEVAGLVHGAIVAETISVEAVDAAGALQEQARDRGADLLVLGSSSRGPLGRVLMGSVTVQSLRDPPCPVAVATVGQRETSAGVRIASVAVGCEVAEEPGAELDLAAELAQELGASLHVVAVADTSVALAAHSGGAMAYPAIVKARRVAAEDWLARIMAGVPRAVSVTGEVREGRPAEKLVEVTHGVDLLVLGSHHYGPVGRLMHRSVSSSLAHNASCPLLVVPPVD